MNTPFKAPQKYAPKTPRTITTSDKSDSDESINSDTSELSTLALFDEFMRLVRSIYDDRNNLQTSYSDVVGQIREILNMYKMLSLENNRLQNVLCDRDHNLSELESKLNVARKLLDQEKRNTRKAEMERDSLLLQINTVKDYLMKEKKNQLSEDVIEKLSFINGAHLSAIPEVNSTGSMLTDLSYSRSEDDLDGDNSKCFQNINWKKHRPSTDGTAPLEPAPKKRRSLSNKFTDVNIGVSDTVKATTTLTVAKEGPITATSVIETVPQVDSNKNFEKLILDTWNKSTPTKTPVRQHVFQQKTTLIRDTCMGCDKPIRFGRTGLKCKQCHTLCHTECKHKIPLPCIPLPNTPNCNVLGVIGDYTPTTPPMVPGIIVHCLNEIEMRGLEEVGLYRVPGSEKDVKTLKERFMRGRGAPSLTDWDIHVICGTVKDFLRSLIDPITTYKLRPHFVRALELKDSAKINDVFCHLIAELPQPNRDTLAYIMLHLKRISEKKECKMPLSNLAKIFGPTIIGYSSDNPDPALLLNETEEQYRIMEKFMQLPHDYWASFINVQQEQLHTGRLQQTPSTDSLLRFTGRGILSASKRQKKIFHTPPSMMK